MEWKRRKELTRDMDRYLASRRKKKINFKSLFRMPFELKPKFPKHSQEKEAKKEESFYETHVNSKSFYQDFLESLKKLFKRPEKEEDYVDFQTVATEKISEIHKESGLKSQEQTSEPKFEPEKKTWFKAFIDIFKPSKDPDYASYPTEELVSYTEPQSEIVSKVKEDLKEVSKIALHVIKKLPKEAVDEFKRTDSFSTFKDILRKHNMIK